MTSTKHSELILPALRGIMGDWVYYSSLLDLNELSARVSYAEQVHEHKALSDMIQRQLDGRRSKEIADYLKTQPQRFFNSLVIATYDGSPNWHALRDVHINTEGHELSQLTQGIVESVGFLTLRGDEKLFALDGQHRLAGIKKAVKDGFGREESDEVSVIFVAHKDTEEGLERTRRLFTTLNKTSKPVSKGDIIALDEEDVMAICVRRLIEETELFTDERIAFVATNNMPVTNKTSLTTIGNLYDVLTILFTNSTFALKKPKADLKNFRPEDDKLDAYFDYSKSYFSRLRQNVDELEEFFSATETELVVSKYRGSHGGNALFRPIGLEIYTKIVTRLTKDMPLERAVKLAARLPRDLNEEPLLGLMWDKREGILSRHKATLREILCYMIGKNAKGYTESDLLQRYRRATGNDKAGLPKKLVAK